MQQTAETSLVGDVFLNPRQIPAVRAIVTNGTYFEDKNAGTVYDAICKTFAATGEIDIPTLNQRLLKAGIAPSHVMEYSEHASLTLGETHARMVVEEHMKRKAKHELQSVVRCLENPAEDVLESLNAAQEALANLRRGFDREKTVHIKKVVDELTDDLDQIFAGKKIVSTPFGFPAVDSVTGGMDPGDLTVIAALEKSGKTTMMIQIVEYNARRGTPCLILSCEMTRKQILLRMALMNTNILWSDLKQNRVTKVEKALVLERIAEYGKLPIFIRHGVMTLAEIAGESKRFVREHGVKLVAVDYIQRVVPVNKKANENREREVAAISSGLKNVALECDVPLIALSQVNDDLRARESRAIEQDMDREILIDRHPDVQPKNTSVSVNLKIRQRMGLSTGMGEIQLGYDLRGGIWRSAEGTGKPAKVELTFDGSNHDSNVA